MTKDQHIQIQARDDLAAKGIKGKTGDAEVDRHCLLLHIEYLDTQIKMLEREKAELSAMLQKRQ